MKFLKLDLVHSLGKISSDKGAKTYLVGGAVRDHFLRINTHDLDFVIVGDWFKVAKSFAKKYHARMSIYERFMSATLMLCPTLDMRVRIDISAARLQSYNRDYVSAHPNIEVVDNIEKDLVCRDFSINAMAVSINEEDYGTLIDPEIGMHDLAHKVIRTLHPQSFWDDPTRIFRAVRLVVKLEFNLHPETQEQMRRAVEQNVFNRLDPHRLHKELANIHTGPHSSLVLSTLKELCGRSSITYTSAGRVERIA